MSTPQQSPAPQVGKLVSVVPVGLKEAALDSPTFRATTVHFADQIDFIEKWLDGYVKSTGRLTTELSALDNATNSFLYQATSTMNVSEAVLDHDYTLLAMKRHGETAKDFWSGMISTAKRFETLVVEPIRTFTMGDLRSFKEMRRILDQSQKQYDHLQARYSSQAKSKEPSSLREDAFQLHEARKIYMKASMDFCVQAPQLKNALDKLLVRVFFDQWREIKVLHDNNASSFAKSSQEMERVKGWIHEMENTEKPSRRELLSARKQIEDAAELAVRPSRELEDYSISTVPYLGSQAPSTVKLTKGMTFKPEKQGWLNLRTLAGKPTRTVWVRRWGFLKNGIFGCLVHGARTGGVEESERIGVLLCGIRPAFQEERRFCFEVKTNNNTIMLQTETQIELMEWIGAFEAAKQKALENPVNTDLSVSGKTTVQDPAFAISQPPALEFAADSSDSLTPNANDELSAPDRTPNLSVPDRDGSATRSSADFANPRRHQSGFERDTDGGRDHTSRIIQKLDLHRKPAPGPQTPWSASSLGPNGGLPGLSPTNQNFLQFGGAAPGNTSSSATRDTTFASFAPTTLANPPAATSMSRAAVVVNNERGIGVGVADNTGGMPSGIMANLWGSSNWGFINILEGGDPMPHHAKELDHQEPESQSSSALKAPAPKPSGASISPPASRHRQTLSLDGDLGDLHNAAPAGRYEYPSYYPSLLKTHDAQFRLLFPNVRRDESLVLVFRATWSPNDQQEFPGRAFVTTKTVYFYSNCFGLVLTTSSDLSCVSEVTAAAGRDCDFLFLHLSPPKGSDTPRRITIKTFLEPFKLLRKRLNFLVKNTNAEEPLGLEAVLKALVKIEQDGPTRSPSVDSWEDVSPNTPADDGLITVRTSGKRAGKDLRAPIYVDKDLDIDSGKTGFGKDVPKFRLPAQPVEYVPQGELHIAVEKLFDVSPKALFHVLFGDKSVVWQLLQHERRAQNIKQGPWTSLNSGHMRRDFEYLIETTDILGRTKKTSVSDYQIVDVFNDHLCYVITDKQTPWHLPFKRYFRLVSKIVITHVSKSKSKLAIFTKVEWLWSPALIKHVINSRAMNDLEQDALDLVDLVSDQVTRLGPRSRTKKAMFVFGDVGRQTQVSQFSGAESLPLEFRRPRKQRTLFPLLLETSGSLLQSAVSSLMIWTFALLRWIWKTSSANGLILSLLFASLFVNGFYSSRDTYQWWHERNAWKFVSRFGIRPDNVMSKAVYIRDIDEVIANTTGIDTYNSSTCFATFWDRNSIGDLDVPLSLTASTPDEDPALKSASRRLRRTLQRLASSRHDLLVGLRVINSIEREVVTTEWERWLQQETHRCQMIEAMLSDEAGGESEGGGMRAQKFFSERTDDVRRWYEDYCLSCQRDREEIMDNSDRRTATL